MRPLSTNLAVLGALLCLVGCAPSPEASPAAEPNAAAAEPAAEATETIDCDWLGDDVEQVMIHQAPAAAQGPFTVKTTPSVPAFHLPEDSSRGLYFVRQPGNAPARWARVGVAGFRNAATGAEIPAENLHGSCSDLTGPDAPETDKCRVTFPSSMGNCWLFKYDILLFAQAQDSAPDLVIDPVGIIK